MTRPRGRGVPARRTLGGWWCPRKVRLEEGAARTRRNLFSRPRARSIRGDCEAPHLSFGYWFW